MDLFDLVTRKKVGHVPAQNWRHLAFTPDGKKVFAHSQEDIRFFDVPGAELFKVVKHEAGFQIGTGYSYCSPDGNFVAAMEHPFAIHILDIRKGKRVATVRTKSPCYLASFSRDNQSLLFVHQSEAVLYNIIAEKIIHRFYPPDNYVQSAAFTPDEKKVVILASAPDSQGGWKYSLFVHELPARFLDPPAARIDDVPPERLWPELQTDNDLRLQLALKAFRSAPKEAVILFRKQSLAIAKERQKQVEDWITALNDEDFRKRDGAMKNVQEVAHDFAPLLRARHKAAGPGEIRNRLSYVLGLMKDEKPPLSLVRELRVVALLQQIGTVEARELLAELAQGAPKARLTTEAQAALDRLAKMKKIR